MLTKDLFFGTFDSIMLQKGFKRKGGTYHRLVNGKIIQMLGSRTEGGGYYFTTTFAVEPLCIGGETSRCFDAERIERFFKVPQWDYHDIKGLARLMPEILEYTELYVLSLFDSITDYNSYLNFHPTGLRAPIPFEQEVRFIDLLQNKYDFYLENREQYLQAWIEENEAYIAEHFERNRRVRSLGQQGISMHRKIFEQNYDFYICMKKALLSNDRIAIEECIRSREKEMLYSYIKAFYGKKKLEKFEEVGELPFDIVIL